MKQFLISFLIAFLWTGSWAQSQLDVPRALAFDEYLQLIIDNHPVSKSALMQEDIGQAYLLKAKGGFDPKIGVDWAEKDYDGKDYYTNGRGELKWDSPIGVQLKGGYENNSGLYVNPENSTPSSGYWYAGLSVPLAQGLLFDDRRAAVGIAGVMNEMALNEQKALLNQLVLEAGKAYWKWYTAHYQLEVFQEGLDLAQQRFEAVRMSALQGDKPLVDTLEAAIQVQNRKVQLNNALLELENAELWLESFLWDLGGEPMRLISGTYPMLEQEVFYTPQSLIMDSALVSHPAIMKYTLELDQLSIQERLNREKLKPSLNVNYYPLSRPYQNDLVPQFAAQNYKWGLQFQMPVFLRKERGELRLTRAKIAQKEWAVDDARAKVQAYINQARNQQRTFAEQAVLLEDMAQNYRDLADAETQLFQTGESSLFLVNQREMGYIQARIKSIESLAKWQQAGVQTAYAEGILWMNQEP
ncbi:MAG: TolC family protein [Flavobacteriales bacterium]|nr:TolC family protein [Flavobacteriales bacterium]